MLRKSTRFDSEFQRLTRTTFSSAVIRLLASPVFQRFKSVPVAFTHSILHFGSIFSHKLRVDFPHYMSKLAT